MHRNREEGGGGRPGGGRGEGGNRGEAGNRGEMGPNGTQPAIENGGPRMQRVSTI